jgi:hypothetical protein
LIEPKNQNTDWPDYRHDERLSGNSSLRGTSLNFRETANISIGGGFQEVLLLPDASNDLLLASGGAILRIGAHGELRWQTRPFGAHYLTGIYDLDDDGELEIVTSNAREIMILSATTGEVLWRENVALPRSYGTYATMFQVHRLLPNESGMQIVVPCFSAKELLIFDCSNGVRATKLLHTLWMDDSYHPTTCIGDVNHDGIEEIVIARLGGVYVFDPVSGKMLDQTLWTSDTERRRNYGHFELADIDNDGDLEAIILSDRVSRHIAVLDNDGNGRFTPLWDRFIQHIYPEDTTELRYVNNSIADVNGDGLPEIIVSLFNLTGDNKWHTEVIEAATGKTLMDLPDRYLRDVSGLCNDGSNQLLLSEAFERIPKSYSALSIEHLSRGTIWQMDAARFAERTIRNAPKRAQFKPDVFANDAVWTSGTDFFVLQSGAESLQLTQIGQANGAFAALHTFDLQSTDCRIAAMQAETIIISCADGEVLSLTDSAKNIFNAGYHLTTEAHISARPGSVPTVVQQDGQSLILTPTFDGFVTCFELMDQKLIEKWRVKGHSRLGYDNVAHACSVIEWNNVRYVIIVDDASFSHSRLSLYSLDGVCFRSYDFPEMPAHRMGTRIGAYDWVRFEHSSGPALMISFFMSPSMNSEFTCAIHLENGTRLWNFDRTGAGEYGRGVGPWGTTSLHSTPQGSEAIFCAKDTIMRIDLESGVLTKPTTLLTSYTADEMKRLGIYKEQGLKTWSSIEDPFTAYGSVMLNDLDGDGVDELICVGSFGGFGVLKDDMIALWWKIASFGDVVYRFPAICDLENRGSFDLVQSHSTGKIVVYNAVTGEERFALAIGAIATDIISADLDGDGCDECSCGTNDGRLLILKVVDDALTIVKDFSVPGGVSSPSVGIVNGVPAILVTTADGALRIFSCE